MRSKNIIFTVLAFSIVGLFIVVGIKAASSNISVNVAGNKVDLSAYNNDYILFNSKNDNVGSIKPVSYWEDLLLRVDVGGSCARLENALPYTELMYSDAFSCTDPLVAMWRATKNDKYLDQIIEHIDKLIDAAKPVKQLTSKYSDNYLGWVDLPSGSSEVSLHEAYQFRYISILLREMKEDSVVMADSNYRQAYERILSFTEKNIVDKWISRGVNSHIFRGRTHIVSHWGHICMNIAMLTKDSVRKASCSNIVSKINNGMPSLNNGSLKGQLVPYTAVPGAIYWTNQFNETPDSLGWPTDTQHGSAEVGYIVEAYDHGIDFDRSIIDGLLVLADKVILPDPSKYPPSWIDGKKHACPPDYQSSSVCAADGTLFTEGFVKLGRYDADWQRRLETYAQSKGTGVDKSTQLYGNAALNAAFLLGEN